VALPCSDDLTLAVAEPRVPAPAAEQQLARALAAGVARGGSRRHQEALSAPSRGAVGAERTKLTHISLEPAGVGVVRIDEFRRFVKCGGLAKGAGWAVIFNGWPLFRYLRGSTRI